MRWALYAGHLKLQQRPHLWDMLQQLPKNMAEIWPEEATWGAPKEYSDTKNNKSDDANQSGTMWMLLRAFKGSGTYVPPPPQLMCEIAPQFNQYETERCQECQGRVGETLPCEFCQKLLCLKCYPVTQHSECREMSNNLDLLPAEKRAAFR